MTGAASFPEPDERTTNLAKDGGRRVMYGGDPYEDDLEPLFQPDEMGAGRESE